MATGPRPKPPPKAPHYPLAKALLLVQDARVGRTRARVEIKKRVPGLTDGQADAFARQMVAGLTSDAFVRPEILTFEEGPIPADLYAVRDKHGDWYVKFYLEGQQLMVILSCHEPEGTLVRADGVKLGKPRK